MNTEKKEITNLDFNFNILNKKEEPIIKHKKSYKKIISLCVLSLFLSGGFYGYKQVDKILNAPVKVYHRDMIFKEYASISPEERLKIKNIYSGKFKGDNFYLSDLLINKSPTYYFNNSSDFKKLYSLLELNKGTDEDYISEKLAIDDGKKYFDSLLEDKIISDLLNGKSPKKLAISKFIDPSMLEQYQSIYEEIYPQIIQSDTSGSFNYKLSKNYELNSTGNSTYNPKDMSLKFLTLIIIKNSQIDLSNSNNIKLWD